MRSRLTLLAIIVMPLLALACSDSPSDPNPPDGPEAPMGAAVTGYVFRVDGGIADRLVASAAGAPGGPPRAPRAAGAQIVIVDAPGSAPAGATVVAGAALQVLDVAGTDVALGATDAEGAFVIDDLPAGSLTLVVRTAGASTPPDAELDFTAIAGATIALGREYAVSREAAIALARADAPENALILGSLQPLPAGTLVRPQRAADASSLARTLAAAEWLFFIDREPNARFDHSVEYVFIDAASAVVTRVDAHEPPAINGRAAWGSDFDFIRYEGIDFAALDPDDLPVEGSAAPGPEVVQLPAGSFERFAQRGDAGSTRLARAATVSASIDLDIVGQLALAGLAPDDIFTLAVRGASGSDLATDLATMTKRFEALAPNPLNREVMDFSKDKLLTGTADYRTRFNRIKQRIEERITAGGKPTFIVYFTGHGGVNDDGTPTGSVTWVGSDDEFLLAGPGSFMLTMARPCKLVFIVDACWAASFADRVVAAYAELAEDQRPEVTVYASCDSDETSKSYDTWQYYIPFASRDPGGVFTNATQGRMSIGSDGGVDGLLDPDGTIIAELEDISTSDGPQHPQVRHLSGDPTWCRSSGGESFISANQTALAFTHQVGVTQCPQPIATVRITNTSKGSVLVTPTVFDTNAISFGTFAFTLQEPGATMDVPVRFDCNTQISFMGTVRFVAMQGQAEQFLEIPVTGTIFR